MVKTLVEEFIDDWEDEDTQVKIKERVMDPIINYLMDRMYPYILLTAIVVFILIGLLFMILFMIVRK